MKFTLRKRILNILLLTHQTFTASELQLCLNCGTTPVKLSSLSSILKKMCDTGEICRVNCYGPRGGYGYHL